MATRTAIESVLEYLVLKQLAGKVGVVKAIYAYFVEGASPSTIARELGLSKHQVRGYVQRIVEKAGSVNRAKVMVKYLVPHVLAIQPIINWINNERGRCTICKSIVSFLGAEDHIRIHHRERVNAIVFEIIEKIRASIHSEESLVGESP